MDRLRAESKERYCSLLDIAIIYAALGKKDETFAWLAKAFDENSPWLIELKVEPAWDKVRSDPRFASLLQRIDLPQ